MIFKNNINYRKNQQIEHEGRGVPEQKSLEKISGGIPEKYQGRTLKDSWRNPQKNLSRKLHGGIKEISIETNVAIPGISEEIHEKFRKESRKKESLKNHRRNLSKNSERNLCIRHEHLRKNFGKKFS